ncbi:MAG TPA: lipoate--protein ligase family protein [Spirochaetota bacterium]|nr:lipoate--protein ligase family protein [Spirochaetota bacterium]HPC42448.1 lipoate--protein ligase family protein [Spirochaetota bacterium]HPL17407.1 lipoate--protein ligase family protein [Spirochaetota bacterium]HQF06565.1 lipoate--protein ligase family protein [Spirochaetota bacterium]HQH96032.1 lipoate--protein ligase family protein [Spirochaetota bacterium]
MQLVRVRLIPHMPRSGPENMALDEYLVSWHRSTGRPVFRLYAWNPPAISLGRYQNIECIDREACRADGVDMVRRITGGGAIYHDRELTYSLACTADDLDRKPTTIPEYYEIINRFLIVFYQWLGFRAVYAKDSDGRSGTVQHAAFCFSSNEKYDIMINGKKIGGNAQRRIGKTVLQHGSIPLFIDRERINRYFRGEMDGSRFTSLSEIIGREPDTAMKIRLLAESFSETTGMRMYQEDITPEEMIVVHSIMNRKYLDHRWTMEGRTEGDEIAAAGMA